MITISKGSHVISVTNGAYETKYKNLGYAPSGGSSSSKTKEPEKVVVAEEKQMDTFLTEFAATDKNKWNKNDVKKAAEMLDVDLSEGGTFGEVKEILIAALKEKGLL